MINQIYSQIAFGCIQIHKNKRKYTLLHVANNKYIIDST